MGEALPQELEYRWSNPPIPNRSLPGLLGIPGLRGRDWGALQPAGKTHDLKQQAPGPGRDAASTDKGRE